MIFSLRKSICSVIIMFLCFPKEMQAQELQAVPFVDLGRYVGTWYEIASFPQSFQRGCFCTTATYSLSDKGFVIVENRCNRNGINGEESYIKGKAFIEKNSGNAKLKVQFFWPFRGKYWIIDLDKEYTYALVSHPNKKYLWILSRSPEMDAQTYQEILSKLASKGFDLSLLKKTTQKK
jgi:apolipoprotein D and lipocalin family protein